MFQIFSDFATWLVYERLNLIPSTKLGDALHFFVEDVSKIFVLLLVLIYFVAILRASLDVGRVRDYLAGKHRGAGYFLGSCFGAITPFCSCSSIPVFLGFTSAGIPLGITMAFLITSPLINEVAVLLLVSLLGWKFTLVYIVVGMAVGIAGGAFLDHIKGERWLADFAADASGTGSNIQLMGSASPPGHSTCLSQGDMPLLKMKRSPFLNESGSGSFSGSGLVRRSMDLCRTDGSRCILVPVSGGPFLSPYWLAFHSIPMRPVSSP